MRKKKLDLKITWVKINLAYKITPEDIPSANLFEK